MHGEGRGKAGVRGYRRLACCRMGDRLGCDSLRRGDTGYFRGGSRRSNPGRGNSERITRACPLFPHQQWIPRPSKSDIT